MAHRTLISGTSYDITGGKTLVSGTSYNISGGKTLVGGTTYDIPFTVSATVLTGVLDGILTRAYCMAYGGGYYAVGGMYYDGGSYYARIAYTTSLGGTWETRDLWTGTSSQNMVTEIKYNSSYTRWLVSGQRYASNTYYAVTSCSSSLYSGWITIQVWSQYEGSSVVKINSSDYTGSYWVAGGTYGDAIDIDDGKYYASIAYKSGLSSGSFSIKDLASYGGSTVSVNSVYYYSGAGWLLMGGTNAYVPTIWYATSPTATPSSKTFTAGAASTSTKVSCITHGDHYYVAGFQYYTSDGQTLSVASSTSPSGTWTETVVASGLSLASEITCIIYANGYYVAGGSYKTSDGAYEAFIAYAASPTGIWTKKTLWSVGTSTNKIIGIAHDGSNFVVCGEYYNGAWYPIVAYFEDPAKL